MRRMSSQNQLFRVICSALFASLIFVGTQFIRVPLPFGYFAYDMVLYHLAGAVAALNGNLLQGAVGAVAGLVITVLVERSRTVKHIQTV